MSLLWIEGFEGFTTAGNRTAMDSTYNFSDQIGTADAGITAGRIGGQAAFIDETTTASDFNTYGVRIPVSGLSSQDDWIVGFAFKSGHEWFSVGNVNSRPNLIQFLDSESNPILSIYPAAGTLNVRRGQSSDSGGTKLGFADALITTNIWNYFEVKVKFHASLGGLVQIRMNEEEIFNVSGVTTASTVSGDLRPSMIIIGGSGNGARIEVDDLYICDDQGAIHNDFLGDNVIARLNPNGVGNSSQFTVLTGPSNYQDVDEDDPDSDTSYVQSKTVGQKDTYAFQDITSDPVTIECVATKSFVKKTDGGSRTFVHVARSGGVEGDSATLYPGGTYRFMQSIFPLDPNTSAAWTKAGVNAAEYGFKIAS